MSREQRTRERILELPIRELKQIDVPGSSSTPVKITDYTNDYTDGYMAIFRDDIYFCVAADDTEAGTNLGDKTKRNLATCGQIELFIRADGDIWVRAKDAAQVLEGIDIRQLQQIVDC